MGANAAGIAGSQVFRTQDAPKYLKAFTVCLALNAANVLEIIGLSLWFYTKNKKLDKEGGAAPEDEKASNGAASSSPEEVARPWRWTW